jgi:hypothetical protein
MKKQLFFTIVLATSLSILGASLALAQSEHDYNYFVSSATIFAVSATSITVRNISDGVVVSSISFGTISSAGTNFGTLAPQYVQLSVNDNSILWVLRAYTDNFPSLPTGDSQYGGLISTTTPSNRISMGWQCSTFTVSGIPVVSSATTPGGSWNYLKDRRDSDFISSRAAGYCNIAFGSASYTQVVEPRVYEPIDKKVSVKLANPAEYFYFLTEADFSSPTNDVYMFNLVLELVHQ